MYKIIYKLGYQDVNCDELINLSRQEANECLAQLVELFGKNNYKIVKQ